MNLHNAAACDMSHKFLFFRECLGPIIGGTLVYRVGFPSMAAIRLRITSCNIQLPHSLERSRTQHGESFTAVPIAHLTEVSIVNHHIIKILYIGVVQTQYITKQKCLKISIMVNLKTFTTMYCSCAILLSTAHL